MSFGFSPSDIVAIISITNKAYTGWKNACGQYSEITGSLDTLLIVLNRIQREASNPISSQLYEADDHQDLRSIITKTGPTVRELHATVSRYQSLGSSRSKNWDRLRLGCKNLEPLRLRLTQHIATITAYLEAIGLGALGRIERGLLKLPEDVQRIIDHLAAEIRAGRRESSILTTYSDDEKAVWKQFRRELISESIKSSIIHRYKPVIIRYLRDLAERGELDEAPQNEESISKTAHAAPSESENRERGDLNVIRVEASGCSCQRFRETDAKLGKMSSRVTVAQKHMAQSREGIEPSERRPNKGKMEIALNGVEEEMSPLLMDPDESRSHSIEDPKLAEHKLSAAIHTAPQPSAQGQRLSQIFECDRPSTHNQDNESHLSKTSQGQNSMTLRKKHKMRQSRTPAEWSANDYMSCLVLEGKGVRRTSYLSRRRHAKSELSSVVHESKSGRRSSYLSHRGQARSVLNAKNLKTLQFEYARKMDEAQEYMAKDLPRPSVVSDPRLEEMINQAQGVKIESGGAVIHVYGNQSIEMVPSKDGERASLIIGGSIGVSHLDIRDDGSEGSWTELEPRYNDSEQEVVPRPDTAEVRDGAPNVADPSVSTPAQDAENFADIGHDEGQV